VAVGQASHAWLCGQLARAWGNAAFAPVVPLSDVALGAEQHDVGMAAWDLEPPLNPATGLPQSFMEMATEANVSLWRAGPVRLVTQSRYGALMAAMHGRRLYERHDLDLDTAPAAEAAAIEAFLSEVRELEAKLLESLRGDPETAAYASGEQVEHNSRLLWTWDTISLALLLDWAPMTLEAVPTTGDRRTDIVMTDLEGGGATGDPVRASFDPWPFQTSSRVRLHCEGRRLTETYESQTALTEGLRRAPWETVTFELVAPPTEET
jgi:hypothetical protein